MEQQMTGTTMSMTHRGHEPSRRAQATRSLRLAEQITDPAQRREAIRKHFAEFVSPPARACSLPQR